MDSLLAAVGWALATHPLQVLIAMIAFYYAGAPLPRGLAATGRTLRPSVKPPLRPAPLRRSA